MNKQISDVDNKSIEVNETFVFLILFSNEIAKLSSFIKEKRKAGINFRVKKYEDIFEKFLKKTP